MNIIKNGKIFDLLNNNTLSIVTKEITLNAFNQISMQSFIQEMERCIIKPVFRLFLLYENEQIRYDITSDFKNGELSITSQNGQRRSLNITLTNHDGKWSASPIGLIWIGTKFRLDIGVVIGSTAYWKQQGIFVLNDPTYSVSSTGNTVSLSLYDKFSLLDGSISGKSSFKTIIPVGTPMKEAFSTLLSTDQGNSIPYDFKHIIFSSKYADYPVPYTVRQDIGETVGDLLIELAESISCNIYYDGYGNLLVKDNSDETAASTNSYIYRFSESAKNVISISETYNWSKMRNKITVRGAIVNGYQFHAEAFNNKKSSEFNNYNCPTKEESITDTKIYSDELCKDRALYELSKYTRGVKSINITSYFLPHIDVDTIVLVKSKSLGLDYSPLIIDSVNVSISSNPTITLSTTNVKDVI